MELNTQPAQNGERVSQGLNGVRERARKNQQERFTTLLHHVNVDLLRESFYGRKRKAAPGVDGVTGKEYETGLEDRRKDLHCRVHRGAYRAQPSKRTYIPKANGKLTKQELRRRMHDPVAPVGEWLKSVLNGYYQYHAVPGNLSVLKRFRRQVARYWFHALGQRSQRRPTWEKLGKRFDHWLPDPQVVHEFPDARFDASHPRVAYPK